MPYNFINFVCQWQQNDAKAFCNYHSYLLCERAVCLCIELRVCQLGYSCIYKLAANNMYHMHSITIDT